MRVARIFLRGPRGAAVVDRLTEVALNRTRSEAIRLAAIGALSALESSTLQCRCAKPSDDVSQDIRDLAQRTRPLAVEPGDFEGYLRQAVERRLPDDPVALRHAIAQASGAAVAAAPSSAGRTNQGARSGRKHRCSGRMDGGAGRGPRRACESRQPPGGCMTSARRSRRRQDLCRWSSSAP